MDSVGVPALDPAADCVFGHEFCAEIVEHGPDTAGTLPVGTRVCSVPIILGPTGVEQIGYSNAYPGALAEHMVLQELLLLPVPDSLDTDLAALTEPLAVGEHAVGLAGLASGTALPRRRAADRSGSPSSPRSRDGATGRCWPPTSRPPGAAWPRPSAPTRSSTPPRGRRTTAGPTSASPAPSWSASGRPCWGVSVPDPVIFEAVGVPGMLQSLIADGPPHSRIVVVGVCMHSDTIEPFMAVTKEMELRFSFGYTPDEFAATLRPAGRRDARGRSPGHVRRSTWPAHPAPSRRCAHPASTARSW